MKILTIITLALTLTTSLFAGATDSKMVTLETPTRFSADVFAIGTFDGDRNDHYKSTFGAGLGLNYNLCKYGAVGVDAYWFDNTSTVHSITASVIGKYPMGDLIPYALVGGGVHFDSVREGSVHAGIGAEYKLNQSFSLVTECRYNWTALDNDFGVAKLGLRLNF